MGQGSERLHVIRVERDVHKLDSRIDPDLELTVVFSHGNRGNMTRYWNRVGYFEELGIHVVAYDYRGYGASSGETSEAHLYEDVETAYDYAVAHGAGAVLSVGYSMGGAAAIWLCSNDSGREVLACFTEAAFASAVAFVASAIDPAQGAP